MAAPDDTTPPEPEFGAGVPDPDAGRPAPEAGRPPAGDVPKDKAPGLPPAEGAGAAPAEPIRLPANAAAKEGNVVSRWVNRVKTNFGKEAWKDSKLKTGFRAISTAAGAFFVIDALARSTKKDDSGAEVSRSGGARLTEAALGVGLALTAPAIGGRGK